MYLDRSDVASSVRQQLDIQAAATPSTLQAMHVDSLRSGVSYITNVSKMIKRCYSGSPRQSVKLAVTQTNASDPLFYSFYELR